MQTQKRILQIWSFGICHTRNGWKDWSIKKICIYLLRISGGYAKAAKEAMSDQEIHGRRVRVDFSITKSAHTRTPGVYIMGRPTYRGGGGDTNIKASKKYWLFFSHKRKSKINRFGSIF